MYKLFTREFLAESPIGAVQIIHGMREHSGRYLDFANFLKSKGYSVFLSDHPFHGRSTKNGFEIEGEKDFFKLAVNEQLNYTQGIKERFPEIPLFILGHSMGSFILQRYMQLPNQASGFILSGSCGKREVSRLGYFLTNFYLKFFKDSYSRNFEKFLFWGFNKKEKNDWLTSNRDIYSSVEEDPHWIFCYPLSFYKQFFRFLMDIYLKNSFLFLDRKKPILIFSGDHDPVGLNGKGVLKLFNQYKELGCQNLSLKLYANGRHEMLNETNKTDVYSDVLSWLNSVNKLTQ